MIMSFSRDHKIFQVCLVVELVVVFLETNQLQSLIFRLEVNHLEVCLELEQELQPALLDSLSISLSQHLTKIKI